MPLKPPFDHFNLYEDVTYGLKDDRYYFESFASKFKAPKYIINTQRIKLLSDTEAPCIEKKEHLT